MLISLILLTITACTQPNAAPPADFPANPPAVASATELIPTPTPSPTPPPEQLLDAGDHALFIGDYETAITIFQSTLAQSDDPALVAKSNLGIGQTYFTQGNTSLGLNYLRTAAVAEDPIIAARAQYLLGQTYTSLQRYDEALLAYETYLSLRPGLIDAHVHELRGDLFITLGDQAGAIASFQEAYRTDPAGGSEALAVKIAIAYQDSGDSDTALALYQDIYNTSSNDYTRAQMDLLIGRIFLAREDREQAYPYFQDAVENFPFSFDAYTALVTLVTDGIEVNEYQRGLVNAYAGNPALAIEAFDRYLAITPEELADAALYQKGLATRDLGDHEEAIALWQALITDHPISDHYADAWQSIVFTQWAYMQEYQQAAQTALTFVAQRPEAPEAANFLFLAGRNYERADMLAEAADTWARIASEYPASEETFRATYFAGIARVRLGDWADAQPLFSRALVLTSEPAQIAAAYLWIGKCQEAQGDIATALDSWKQAQIANPFGHYSLRAEDLLIGRGVFTEPESFDLNPDLTPYRLEAEAWLRTTFNLPEDINLESPGMLALDPRFQRGHEYWALGNYEAAKAEFESMRLEFAADPAQTFRLIPALIEIGLYRSALIASTNLLKSAGLEGAAALEAPEFFSRVRFGAYYLDWLLPVAESENISPLLMLSLIRQESTYEGFISSVAGARGLMQIMPATGAELATSLGWPEDYTVDDLFRPYVNLVLGASYMRRQRQFFNGDLFAMLAAYNGGPGNTIAWKALTPTDDPDLFLEIIRLEETRNYIRLINEIHAVYRWLYGEPLEP